MSSSSFSYCSIHDIGVSRKGAASGNIPYGLQNFVHRSAVKFIGLQKLENIFAS